MHQGAAQHAAGRVDAQRLDQAAGIEVAVAGADVVRGEGVAKPLRFNALDGEGDKAEAVINFSGVGLKHLSLAWAPLTRR